MMHKLFYIMREYWVTIWMVCPFQHFSLNPGVNESLYLGKHWWYMKRIISHAMILKIFQRIFPHWHHLSCPFGILYTESWIAQTPFLNSQLSTHFDFPRRFSSHFYVWKRHAKVKPMGRAVPWLRAKASLEWDMWNGGAAPKNRKAPLIPAFKLSRQ